MYGDKHMDHAAYQAKVKAMTTEALRYTIRDARRAIDANPENPNAGYYQDEICYCSEELHRRRTSGMHNDRAWMAQMMETADALVERLMDTVDGDYAGARARLLEALANENVQQVLVQAVSEVVLPCDSTRKG